jgi:hypothetical protein
MNAIVRPNEMAVAEILKYVGSWGMMKYADGRPDEEALEILRQFRPLS